MVQRADVIVLGGGLVGLAAAWRLSGHGLAVTIVDPEPMSGAGRVAAGMLAPVTEAHYGEQLLLDLLLVAARDYPTDVAQLEAAAGRQVGYRRTGTLAVAMDTDDRAELAELAAFHERLGLRSRLVGSREMRTLEPLLAPGTRGGLVADDDHSVDNRRLGAALLAACVAAGVQLVRESGRFEPGATPGVRLSGGRLSASTVVLATGATRTWPSLPGADVSPVRGVTLRLRGEPGLLARTVRAVVRGTPVYLVPREDGEVVLGATSEHSASLAVRAGEVHDLLRDAVELLPRVAELELVEARAGLRPATPDHRPLVGPIAEGTWVATGTYRNGVLLCLLLGRLLAEAVTTGRTDPLLSGCDPGRFAASLADTATAGATA